MWLQKGGLSQKDLLELRGPSIAAHRGRGVNVKPNDWPENTLAAAKATIQQFNASDPHGGRAIECDIHVTKDGYAILVHGPLVVNNYYCVRDKALTELAEKIGKDPGELNFDELTFGQVQTLTVDTAPESAKIPAGLVLQDYRIPTLYEFLGLIAETNADRIKQNQFPLLAYIELKGSGSGLATPLEIERFKQDQAEKKQPTIDPAHIVLLGRVNETYELTVARQFADQHAEFNKQSGQAVSLLEFVQDHYPRAKELIKNVFAFFLKYSSSIDIGCRYVASDVCQSFVASQHEYEELPDRAFQGLDKSGVENIRDIFCNHLQLEPAALQRLKGYLRDIKKRNASFKALQGKMSFVIGKNTMVNFMN